MSPKTLLVAAAAIAAASVAALPASADQNQDRPAPLRAQILFNLVDVNGDGAIDQAEIAALQKAIFAAVDANDDGKLSQDEFGRMTAGPRGGPGRHGHLMGRGGPRAPGFHGPRGDHRQGQMEPHGPGQGFGPDGGMMPQLGGEMGPPEGFPGGAPRDFASLDSNGDGAVSPEEFAAGALRLPLLPR